MKPTSLRLFVAVEIPEPVRNEMSRVQADLRPLAAPGDVRWTNPAQLHLTLKFLGNVPEDLLELVKKSLTGACTGIRPFPLRATGIGFFPNERRPRVIWVGFDDNESALTGLQARVEKSLAAFAEKPGTEKFLAHATLGRFQKFRCHKTEKFVPGAQSFANYSFGEWRVEEVGLFRSELSSEGARHTRLSSYRLIPT